MPRIITYTEDGTPDPNSQILTLEGGQNYAVPLYLAGYSVNQFKTVPLVCEFLGGSAAAQLAPFTTSAIGAGTIAQIASESQHPGIWRIASAAGANSGNSVGTFGVSSFLIGGGEVGEFVIRWPTTTNVTSRAGWYDENTLTANPTDGVWIDLSGTTLTGKTANNGSVSTTASSFTITANTWYFARIVVNEGATLVTFYLYSAAGVLQWSDTLSTNIPTAAGRETDFRTSAIKTTATGANIEDIDWMAHYHMKALTR